MYKRRCIYPTRLLARGRSTSHERIIPSIIKAMAVCLAIIFNAWVDRENIQSLWAVYAPVELQSHRRLSVNSLAQGPDPVILLALGSQVTFRGSTLAFHQTSAMPKAQGKPRRGAAWYTAESRQQRKLNFEKAITMATRRRNKTP